MTGTSVPRFVPLKPKASPAPPSDDAIVTEERHFTPFLTPTPVPTPIPTAPPAAGTDGGARYILVPILPAESVGTPIDWRSPSVIRSLRFRMVTDEEMTKIRELADRMKLPAKGSSTSSAGGGAAGLPEEPVEIPGDALVVDPEEVPREMEYKPQKPRKTRPRTP